jgi:hypothetical protein
VDIPDNIVSFLLENDWHSKPIANALLDVPTAVRSYDIVDSDTDQETLGGNKLIKEQWLKNILILDIFHFWSQF